MKLLRYTLLWLASLTGVVSLAQQNLFNVPSSDITLEGEPFYQQQINIYAGELQFNSTFCWGLGHRIEVGFNVLELNLRTNTKPLLETNKDRDAPPVYPLYTLNLQKAFDISKVFKLGVGTQCGVAAGSHFVDYSYANLVTAIPTIHAKIISGIYGGNDSFLGPETRLGVLQHDSELGYQVGVEMQLIPEKFSVIAENISGLHSLGEESFGAAYYLSPNWILSGAYLKSNTGGAGDNAIVAELTFSPSSKVHLRIFKHGHRVHSSES